VPLTLKKKRNRMKKNLLLLITITCIIGTLHAADASKSQHPEPQTKEDCLPRINRIKLMPETEDYSLTCLKNGLTNILWGYKELNFEKGINEQEWNNKTFGTLKFNLFSVINGEVKSFPQGAIIYRKKGDGERNALLLEKYFLEHNMTVYGQYIEIMINSVPTVSLEERYEMTRGLFENDNAYIVGKFLEYSEGDIELFYQHVRAGNDPAVEKAAEGRDSDAGQQAYAKAVQSWAAAHTDLWKPEFDKDKHAYKEWMAINKNIPNATLRRQNEALSKAIGTLYYAR
jgi:hypothetical protein